jgi:hypothetical protein
MITNGKLRCELLSFADLLDSSIFRPVRKYFQGEKTETATPPVAQPVEERWVYKTVISLKNGKKLTKVEPTYRDALCRVNACWDDMSGAAIEGLVWSDTGDYVTRYVMEYKVMACAHIVFTDGHSFDMKMPSREALVRRVREIPNQIVCELFSDVETTTVAV